MSPAFTRRWVTILAVTVVILSLFTTAALADELYARVRGSITDATGAVLPGVAVKVTNIATGVSKTTTSGADGNFEVINLIPGTYTVTASKTGFAAVTISNMKLLANQVYVSPIAMKVGTVSEEVTVSANPAQVEQTSIQLTSTISDKTITDLPLNGRNWVTLQQSLPGVVLPDTRFGTNYSTNGSQSQQNSFLINGTDANDLPLNSPLAPPNPDSISEVRMVTNTINPEYGRNSGAIMNAITKSGTNSFHGTAFEFYRDTSLNTHNFFQLHPSKFHQNQYGGTVGGPIWKNKSFFFFSAQITRNVTPSVNFPSGLTTVYTPGQLNGNFGAQLDPATLCGSSFVVGVSQPCAKLVALGSKFSPIPLIGSDGLSHPAGTPYNWMGCYSPIAGTTPQQYAFAAGCSPLFPTGQVPVANFSAFSKGLVSQFVPQPNFGTKQFSWTPSATAKTNQYIGRFDQNLGTKNAFWFYGYANNSNSLDDAPFQTGSTLPGFGSTQFAATKQFTASWSRTITNNMLNELRVGYTRLAFQAVFPQHILSPSSVGFTNIFPQIAAGATWPVMQIPGYFNLGFSTNGPQPRKDQTYQITDNFSWIKGRHSIKLGYEGRKFQVWNPFGARNSGFFSFATSGRYSTGDAGLNFLLGFPGSYNQQSGSVIIAQAYEHYMYLQDAWRMRDNLTLTFGTGYQIDTPINEYQNGGLSRVCFIPGQVSKVFPTGPAGYNWPGDAGCNAAGGPTTKYAHFGPRVGFNYSPNWGWLSGGSGKMSIRGGIGVYYNRGEEELNLQDLGDPPIGASTGGIADISTRANPFSPSFPNPFVDIRTGTVLPNVFPYVPPAAGTPVSFDGVFPVSGGFSTQNANNTIPRAVNFNLTVERELPGQTIVRVGYVGAMARHLVTSYTFNPVTAAGLAACKLDANCTEDPDNQAVNFADHFLFGGTFGSAGQIRTNGTSNYNSLQVTVDKHLGHGLQMLGTYTWAHSLDVGSSFEDTAFLAAGGFDPNGNLKRDYGDSAFDTRHRMTLSASYDIPNLNKWSAFSWMPSRIFGGWRMTGVNAFQTGQPILFQDSNDLSLQCSGNYSFYSCPDRPDFVSKATGLNPRNTVFNGVNHMFFDPAAFTDNAVGTLGTIRRGYLHGPGYWNIDFSLQKDTKITEGTMIQLRAEAFNFLNHTNFANPSANVASPSTFGQISAIRSNTNSRLVQLGAKFIF